MHSPINKKLISVITRRGNLDILMFSHCVPILFSHESRDA